MSILQYMGDKVREAPLAPDIPGARFKSIFENLILRTQKMEKKTRN
jgi:hypothetical protein